MRAPQEMDVFCRVVEHGSFAAAAQDLGLTPSAVSKIVSRTEDRLGVRLLTRTTRRLALTAEGETYLAHARTILDAIEDAESEVMRSSRRPSGLLRVTAATTVAKYLIAPILPAFLARHPEIEIDLNVSDQIVDVVGERIDVALRTGHLGNSTLVARKVAEFSRTICASPAYLERHGVPKTPADLHGHNCLSLSVYPNHRHWPFLSPDGTTELTVHGDFTCDSADVLHEMAREGLGIIRLADFLVRDDIAQGTLVPLLAGTYADDAFPISAVTPPGRLRAPRVKVFVNFLAEHLGAMRVSPSSSSVRSGPAASS